MTHINCVHKQSLFAYAISTKFSLVGLYIGNVTYVTLMIRYILWASARDFSIYRITVQQMRK